MLVLVYCCDWGWWLYEVPIVRTVLGPAVAQQTVVPLPARREDGGPRLTLPPFLLTPPQLTGAVELISAGEGFNFHLGGEDDGAAITVQGFITGTSTNIPLPLSLPLSLPLHLHLPQSLLLVSPHWADSGDVPLQASGEITAALEPVTANYFSRNSVGFNLPLIFLLVNSEIRK